MSIITVGIDLAKNIFAVHGMDQYGKAVLIKPQVARDQLAAMIAQLPPCLIAPKFVTPYRMSGRRGRNDVADAVAICEGVARPNMRFVPIKEEHQQVILTCTTPGKALSKNAPPPTAGCAG